MEPLTAEKARELLARAVAEKGEDYVYEWQEGAYTYACMYFHGDQPGCIIGHLLAYQGVKPEDLGDYNTWDVGTLAEQDLDVGTLAEQGLIDAPLPVVKALAKAQLAQDDGATWGEALKAFDAEIAGQSA